MLNTEFVLKKICPTVFLNLLFLSCFILNYGFAQPLQPTSQELYQMQKISERALSLEECVSIALAKNPAIKEAVENLSVTEARTGKERSPLLPSLTFTYSAANTLNSKGAPIVSTFGDTTRNVQSQPITISTFKDQFALSQLIYDGGQIKARIDAAKAVNREQGAHLEEQRRQVVLSVAKTFYNLLSAKELVSVNEENLNKTKEHLRFAEANFKAGVVAKADVAFAKVPVAKAELELIKAQNELKLSMAGLVSTMGLEVNTELNLKEESKRQEVKMLSLEEALSEAIAKRPELEAARERIKAQEANIKWAKAGRSPTLFVSASYGWTGYSNEFLPGSPNNSIGTSLSMPLFDGRLTKYKVEEADAMLKSTKASLESITNAVLLDVKQAYLNLTASQAKQKAASTALEYAKENLRLVEGQYKTGVVSIINLVDARTLYLEGVTELSNTIYEQKLSGIIYLFAAGRNPFP